MKDFEHPACDFSHFTRVFELSLELAKVQQVNVVDKALYAAAYLQDIGAFEPYKQENNDHSDIAVENCDETLNSIKFTLEKISSVKEIIKSHIFYTKTGESIKSKIFHDVDTLDFLGIIGITRTSSIVGKVDWTADLESAIKLFKNLGRSCIIH